MTATTYEFGRPRLIEDLPKWQKRGVILLILVTGVVCAKVFRYWYVAFYYDVIELWRPITDGWHHLVSNSIVRHLYRDDGEYVAAGVTAQIVAYYFAKHWPLKPVNLWDKVERALLVPNAKINYKHKALRVASLILTPLWVMVYATPGFAIGYYGLEYAGKWTVGHSLNAVHPTWQVTVIGLFASFVMSRRVAKGFAHHIQKVIVAQRLERGKTGPAWWMHLFPTLKWRFQWEQHRFHGKRERVWKHHRTQAVLRWSVKTLVICGVIFMIIQGHVILANAA